MTYQPAVSTTRQTTARKLKVGMKMDTDAGPRVIESVTAHKAPVSGSTTVTVKIEGYPHPIHLRPDDDVNVVEDDDVATYNEAQEHYA